METGTTVRRNFYEKFQSQDTVRIPSDRIFGITFASILAIFGLFKMIFWSGWAGGIFLCAAITIAALTFFKPAAITVIKLFFVKAAPVIGSILNPVLMAILYSVCFVPGGLIMRMFRYDPLRRKFDSHAVSYWMKREPHGLLDPMKYQF